MNNRIEELAKQAGMLKDKYGMYYAKEDHCEDGVDLEEFAKLIINKALDIVYDEVQYDCNFDTADSVVAAVRKHFGIAWNPKTRRYELKDA